MYRTEVFSQQHGVIATCDWTPKHDGNGVIETYREHNARLIAAAPELLEALQAMTTEFYSGDVNDGEWVAIQKARAAIARVTGEMNEPR